MYSAFSVSHTHYLQAFMSVPVLLYLNALLLYVLWRAFFTTPHPFDRRTGRTSVPQEEGRWRRVCVCICIYYCVGVALSISYLKIILKALKNEKHRRQPGCASSAHNARHRSSSLSRRSLVSGKRCPYGCTAFVTAAVLTVRWPLVAVFRRALMPAATRQASPAPPATTQNVLPTATMRAFTCASVQRAGSPTATFTTYSRIASSNRAWYSA